MKPKVDIEKIRSVTIDYKDMCDDNCYVVINEWSNGEGWDITIQEKGVDKMFSLGFDNMSALMLGIETLNLNKGD